MANARCVCVWEMGSRRRPPADCAALFLCFVLKIRWRCWTYQPGCGVRVCCSLSTFRWNFRSVSLRESSLKNQEARSREKLLSSVSLNFPIYKKIFIIHLYYYYYHNFSKILILFILLLKHFHTHLLIHYLFIVYICTRTYIFC